MKNRYKCSHCGRILTTDKLVSLKCGSCGYGTMQIMDIKTHCYICKKPIYDNVIIKDAEDDWDVFCWRCTAKRVNVAERLEEITKIEIKNKKDYEYACMLYRTQHDTEKLGEQLKEARLKKGWSQTILGLKLGTSADSIKEMEKSRKSLIPKALDFIDGADIN